VSVVSVANVGKEIAAQKRLDILSRCFKLIREKKRVLLPVQRFNRLTNINKRRFEGGLDPDLSRLFHMASRPVRDTIKVPCSDDGVIVYVDQLGSPLECGRLRNISFGALSTVPTSTLLDAEWY
ncbi:unnamed protein product, partial [Larinioides sclopetarius]